MMLLSLLAVVFADGGETGGEGSDGNGTALIIGCMVGGVILVAVVIAVIYCCYCRKAVSSGKDIALETRSEERAENV